MTAWQQFEHYPAEARLGRPGLRHDEMLGCLVEVFGRHDSVWVSAWLDEASRALFGAAQLPLSGAPPPETSVQMRLRCPHQVAFVTLTQLVRLGPPEVRAPAKRLIRALPACDGNKDA